MKLKSIFSRGISLEINCKHYADKAMADEIDNQQPRVMSTVGLALFVPFFFVFVFVDMQTPNENGQSGTTKS